MTTTRLLFAIIFTAITAQVSAQQVIMKAEGTKQGMFKGDGSSMAFKDYIMVSGFSYEASMPGTGFGSGISVGRRTNTPLILVKNTTASSLQFFEAFNNGEVLKKVTLTSLKADPNGTMSKDITIELNNVMVSGFKQAIGKTSTSTETNSTLLQDEIKLTYQSITIIHEKSGVSAVSN